MIVCGRFLAGIAPGTGLGGYGWQCAWLGLVGLVGLVGLAGAAGASSPAETPSAHPGVTHQMPPSCSRIRPAALTRSSESRCARSAAAPGAVIR